MATTVDRDLVAGAVVTSSIRASASALFLMEGLAIGARISFREGALANTVGLILGLKLSTREWSTLACAITFVKELTRSASWPRFGALTSARLRVPDLSSWAGTLVGTDALASVIDLRVDLADKVSWKRLSFAASVFGANTEATLRILREEWRATVSSCTRWEIVTGNILRSRADTWASSVDILEVERLWCSASHCFGSRADAVATRFSSKDEYTVTGLWWALTSSGVLWGALTGTLDWVDLETFFALVGGGCTKKETVTSAVEGIVLLKRVARVSIWCIRGAHTSASVWGLGGLSLASSIGALAFASVGVKDFVGVCAISYAAVTDTSTVLVLPLALSFFTLNSNALALASEWVPKFGLLASRQAWWADTSASLVLILVGPCSLVGAREFWAFAFAIIIVP